MDKITKPYLNAEGDYSKTIAYSLWHIFRIEDIVVNSLIRRAIAGKKSSLHVFRRKGHQRKCLSGQK